MRYDEKTDILSVSVREAVFAVRRRIGTAVCDADEPNFSGSATVRLSRTVSDGEHVFLLFGDAESACDGTIEMRFTTETAKEFKKKQAKAQARGEAFMLAALYLFENELDSVRLKIEFVARQSGEVSVSEETISKAKIFDFFDKCRKELSQVLCAEIERLTERVPSMKTVKFPYGQARGGQAQFVKEAYHAIAKGKILYATAPTGTGKTVSALFPAIRAMGSGICSKVFYLTPKQTTAKAAEECIARLCDMGANIRSVTLIAKEKQCKRGLVCHTGKHLCPANNENKLGDAVASLFSKKLHVVTHKEIGEVAKEYTVCPYELSLTYAELCDVVICDVNYLFDPQVYIRRFFSEPKDYAVLIDEAHNLSERARDMYSAELSLSTLAELEPLGPFSQLKKACEKAKEELEKLLLPLIRDELRPDKDGVLHGAYHTRELPFEIYALFENLILTAEEELHAAFLTKDEEKTERISFIREHSFMLKKFYDAAMRFDGGFEFFVFFDGGEMRIKIFCLDTGGVLRRRLELASSAVLFSATLSPIDFYRSVLGGDRSSATLTLDSPFDKGQLCVSVMNKITTRFSEREDSLAAVCSVIAATLSAKRGNYMIFAPSFAYAEILCEKFKKKYPKIKTILQKPSATQKEKRDFLAEFSNTDGSYLAAFCVLGGIFSEGIDLVGDKLIGAVIVGIGMPQLSFEREAIAAYYQEKLESGVEYAYLYPGMNRVLQAAGRVIRSEDDRGVIVLIDDRFNDPLYKKIMPSLWSGMQFLSTARELKERLDDFWLESEE